jgi:hypothetical protein
MILKWKFASRIVAGKHQGKGAPIRQAMVWLIRSSGVMRYFLGGNVPKNQNSSGGCWIPFGFVPALIFRIVKLEADLNMVLNHLT